ncbi:hypothetical protein BDZ97DRAFT_1667567 [Flammula alnicola]|nr:hypothetical protein BDZ97DRAFT_1667567 [Flammula alnicola]
METEAPPAKRARMDHSHEIGENDVVIRSKFWFDDGNVILQVDNTQFRVHRSVLSRHSNVFCDMFNLPQPEDERSPETCPVVPLYDTVEQVTHIISFLYDNIISYNLRNPLPFAVLESMLRLGKKYEFDHLQKEATTRLHLEFPQKIEDWDAIYDARDDSSEIEDVYAVLFDIVHLARELSITTILPAAYAACLCGFSIIVRGIRRQDTSMMQMKPDAFATLMLGRDKLIRHGAKFALTWLYHGRIIPASTCNAPNGCTRAKEKLIGKLWKNEDQHMFALEPWFADMGAGLCPTCVMVAKRTHNEGRTIVWERLPSYFELPPWKELKDYGT